MLDAASTQHACMNATRNSTCMHERNEELNMHAWTQRGTQHACMNATRNSTCMHECNEEPTFNACEMMRSSRTYHMMACNVQWEKMFSCNGETRLHPCKKASTRPSMHWATKLAGVNVGMGAYSYLHSFCFASTKFSTLRVCKYEYEYEHWNFKMRVRVRVLKFQNASTSTSNEISKCEYASTSTSTDFQKCEYASTSKCANT
jgi:hypothetical protein